MASTILHMGTDKIIYLVRYLQAISELVTGSLTISEAV